MKKEQLFLHLNFENSCVKLTDEFEINHSLSAGYGSRHDNLYKSILSYIPIIQNQKIIIFLCYYNIKSQIVIRKIVKVAVLGIWKLIEFHFVKKQNSNSARRPDFDGKIRTTR